MAPPKKKFNMVLCKRCGRRGHHWYECRRVDSIDKRLIRTTESEKIKMQTSSPGKAPQTKRIARGSVSLDPFYLYPACYHSQWMTLDNSEIESNVGHGIPGVYELAQKSAKSGKSSVVYVGMSCNVRERLKDHHFRRRISYAGIERTSNLRRYVEDVRKRGMEICFRWLALTSGRQAKEVESELLEKYDYPWNIDENGKSGRYVL